MYILKRLKPRYTHKKPENREYKEKCSKLTEPQIGLDDDRSRESSSNVVKIMERKCVQMKERKEI